MKHIDLIEIKLYNNDELIDNKDFINSLISNDPFWNSTEKFNLHQICERILITLINNNNTFNKIEIYEFGNITRFKKCNNNTYEYEWLYNDGIHNIDKLKLKRTNIINCNCFKDVYEVYIYDLIMNDYNIGKDIKKYSNNHSNNNLFKIDF